MVIEIVVWDGDGFCDVCKGCCIEVMLVKEIVGGCNDVIMGWGFRYEGCFWWVWCCRIVVLIYLLG